MKQIHLARLVTLVILLGAIGTIFVITGNKINQYGTSDPLLSLPTSQTLWKTGRVNLDEHLDATVMPSGQTLADISDGFRVIEVDGRTVDYFPAGPAILNLPLTAVLTSAGYDFVDPDTNLAVQNRLAFISSVIVFLLIFGLAKLWHPTADALVFGLVAFFGSVIFSTMGAAFWSINYTVIFNTAVITILTLKKSVWKDGRYATALSITLGVLLFLSFFCRVSSVAIIVCTLAYLFFTDFKQSIISGVAALICLALFALWSQYEYGLVLPPYYGLNRLNDAPVPMWVGLYGNLISPSRGVFVFMPWLLLPVGWLAYRPKLLTKPLVIYCVAWFMLQLVIVSRAVIWWGGGSFGPRLMVESMPAMILLSLIVWEDVKESGSNFRPWAISLFVLAGVFSIWMHSWQAFYNPYTGGFWQATAQPVVGDSQPGLGPYFDWSFAQWRADETMICELEHIHFEEQILPYEDSLEPIGLDETISYNDDKQLNFQERALSQLLYKRTTAAYEPGTGNLALFQGLYVEKPDGRWSGCPTATVYFLADESLRGAETLRFEVNLEGLDSQAVQVTVNGRNAGAVQVTPSAESHSVSVPSDWFVEGINEVKLDIPLRRRPTLAQDDFDFYGPLGVKFTEFKFSSD